MCNKLKLVFKDPQYIINKKKNTVTCILNCSYLYDLHDHIPQKHYEIYNRNFIACGVARCNSKDTFNKVIGKRIAESKAKTKAYSIYIKKLQKVKHLLFKSQQVIDYNISVMNDFINREEKHYKLLTE